MSKKIAFLTTIFPMKEQYLIDFFNSLKRQTYKGFDIVVINDGYDGFEDLSKKYSELNIIELKYQNRPAKNREYGINYVIDNGYDILIFGDSDDYFSENRVQQSIEFLDRYDIVVNDLSLFDEGGIYEKCYISNRVKNNTIVKYDFIKDKNIFGLSNTAINLNILDRLTIDKDIVAVDWFIYKKLLKERYIAIFTNETVTYYRQYGNNTVGLNSQDGSYPLWWEKN
jgi:glycosyltransferase involved in cell wall biosynthesis